MRVEPPAKTLQIAAATWRIETRIPRFRFLPNYFGSCFSTDWAVLGKLWLTRTQRRLTQTLSNRRSTYNVESRPITHERHETYVP